MPINRLRRPTLLLCTFITPLMLGGCVVRSVANVATSPVRAASQVADWTTTSQDEADRNRGRELRKREERLGELEREYLRQQKDCDNGDHNACAEAKASRDEMQALKASLPAAP